MIAGLIGTAHAEYIDTYYLKGFTRTLGMVGTATDSIPAGTTYTSPWIPISGAEQVNFFLHAAAADSDSVVTVKVANADTTAGIALTIATATTTVAPMGQGVGAYSNYAGTGGVSWGPALARTISLVPLLGVNAALNYIPMRWVRFTVTAPNAGTVAAGSWNSAKLNTMHSVKAWVEIRRETQPRGDNAYSPLSGAAQ